MIDSKIKTETTKKTNEKINLKLQSEKIEDVKTVSDVNNKTTNAKSNKTNLMLMSEFGRKFAYKGVDVHTQYGFVKSTEIECAKIGDELKTNKGFVLTLIEPDFMDLYCKIKRLAQIIPLKDVGCIISSTGMSKNSIVLDAGSGSGGLACFLANIVKKMYTYDIRDDHIEVVKKNIDYLNLKNLYSFKGNVYDGVKQKNIDVMILDVPEPWLAINTAKKTLKVGGYLVSYSPHIPQTVDFVNTLKQDNSFVYMKTVEISEREWEIDGRKVRPETSRIGHSGFISFARLIKQEQ